MNFTELKFLFLKVGYRRVLKPLLFLFDPERVHRFFISIGKVLGKFRVSRYLVRKMFSYESEFLKQEFFGIEFPNPIGLSAGFDKDGEITEILEDVGFGFVEVGGVTAKACKGNKGKRLERLKEKESLWINLGLNNSGTDIVSERVVDANNSVPIGFNVAKTNCKETVDLEVGVKDYIESFKILENKNSGSYYTLNISCPNAFGGQPFSDSKSFSKLIGAVDNLKLKKPLFVKISPDLTEKELKNILRISLKHNVSGFICTNLTKKHSFGKGGLSGKVVSEKSRELLKLVHKTLGKRRSEFVIVSVGGVFDVNEAYLRLKSGADLIQLITGMIFNGPGIIGEINYGLEKMAKAEGYSSLKNLVDEHRNIYK